MTSKATRTAHSRQTVSTAEVKDSYNDYRGGVSEDKKEPNSSPKQCVPTREQALETHPQAREQSTSVNAKVAMEVAAQDSGGKISTANVTLPVAVDYGKFKGPVLDAAEFVRTGREKLTYRITLLKVPVGTAVLEAANIDGEFRIRVKITSNAVFSAIYPVDDLVETRMIKGNYLLTRVRQKERNYRGDFGFTLMLREHKAFWVDRLTKRYDYQPIPSDDVMDAVSGFYFLRNRALEVGKSVQLNLFDSNEYSPTTVEVLRRERIGLPGSREVDTLVLHPLFKTAGFFRRTGDITIWLTDDKFRVPVRMETFITLGKVTAELVSAESEQEENSRANEMPCTSPDKSGQVSLEDIPAKGKILSPSFACN